MANSQVLFVNHCCKMRHACTERVIVDMNQWMTQMEKMAISLAGTM